MRKLTLLTFAFMLLLWLLLTTSTFNPKKQGERGRLVAQSYEATPCLIIERPRTLETDIEIFCSNGYARQFIRRAPHPSNNPPPIVGNHAYLTRATINEATQSYSLDFSELLRTFPELALPYWQQGPGANITLTNRMAREQVQANYLWTCYGAGGPSCYDNILDVQMVSSNKAWAVTDWSILHYQNGEWDVDFEQDGFRLYSISMISDSYGWAVGRTSRDGHSIDVALFRDGDGWQVMDIPASAETIDIAAIDDVWAVAYGYYDWENERWFSKALHWDGAAWSVRYELPLSWVEELVMVSPDNGWVLGQDDDSNNVIMHWDGTAWKETPLPATQRLRAIAFDENEGWAAGNEGTVIHWNGENWALMNSHQAGVSIQAIGMASNDDVWFLGAFNRGLHWDGNTLSPEWIPTNNRINAISFYSPDTGFAVGNYGALLTYNGQWTNAGNPDSEALYDLDMISSTDGWATTYQNILHFDGVDWEYVYAPSSQVYSIEMLSSDEGWATGGDGDEAQGQILYWNGEYWNTVSNPSPNTSYLVDIKMLSPDLGWIVGRADRFHSGGIVVLVWNGETWSIMEDNFPDSYYAQAILPFSEDDIWVFGSKSAPNQGFCNISGLPPEDSLAYPLAIHWDGEAWTEIPPTDDPFYCGVSMQAAGGAASDDIWTALSFHWNGQQWTSYPSYIDDRLSSIQMLSSNDGWDTYGGGLWQGWGMGWGRIRHWDGTSWITTRIPTSQGIAKIDMISTTEGWAVGYGGAILHFRGDAPVGKYNYLPIIGKLSSGN